ncbi:hypothetical protein TNCT_11871, partial [Trichonephila clavata]
MITAQYNFHSRHVLVGLAGGRVYGAVAASSTLPLSSRNSLYHRKTTRSTYSSIT